MPCLGSTRPALAQILKSQCPSTFTMENLLYTGLLRIEAVCGDEIGSRRDKVGFDAHLPLWRIEAGEVSSIHRVILDRALFMKID